MGVKTYYKLARPDGFDFYTGETINYRDNVGKIVKPPKADRKGSLCSPAFIHASDEPNKCFVGTKIPCSAYLVSGSPITCDEEKCGFVELEILKEITDLDELFGWRYNEAVNPFHPFRDSTAKRNMTPERMQLLRNWASVRTSVWVSVRDSVRTSVWVSVRDSVGTSVWTSVGALVWTSIWDSVGDSVRDSVRDSARNSVGELLWAYLGSLFPNITKWKYVEHKEGIYPFQAAVDLWKQGIVPSFDGEYWRLHSSKQAKIIWEGVLE